jgi:hypothetical protein
MHVYGVLSCCQGGLTEVPHLIYSPSIYSGLVVIVNRIVAKETAAKAWHPVPLVPHVQLQTIIPGAFIFKSYLLTTRGLEGASSMPGSPKDTESFEMGVSGSLSGAEHVTCPERRPTPSHVRLLTIYEPRYWSKQTTHGRVRTVSRKRRVLFITVYTASLPKNTPPTNRCKTRPWNSPRNQAPMPTVHDPDGPGEETNVNGKASDECAQTRVLLQSYIQE